jgi:hypothetical protein
MKVFNVPRNLLTREEAESGVKEEDKLKECLINQNAKIRDGITSEDDLRIKFYLRERAADQTKDSRIAVIEVSASLRKIILGMDRVFVGYRSVRIKDFTLVNRCFKCCGFNHFAKDCRSEQVCSECSGNHAFKDCPKTTKACINCKNFKLKSREPDKIDECHNALDSCCQKYLFMKQKIDEMTNF